VLINLQIKNIYVKLNTHEDTKPAIAVNEKTHLTTTLCKNKYIQIFKVNF